MEITGSIPRAASILDVLAETPDGLSLAEIVIRTGFSKTTAFRVLAALQQARFVVQDPVGRDYRLGCKLVDMAHVSARADIAALAGPGCVRLAELSEDTVFLSVPEGALAICVLRKTGAFPVRTLTLDQGDARPLGVGAGSLALFCAMSAEKRRAICRVNRGWLKEYGTNMDELMRQCASYKAKGYAMNRGQVVEGTSAVSVPVTLQDGELIAAIAIGAIDARMTDERITNILVPALKREVALIAATMDDREERGAS